jgi:hypothetical protein
MLRTSLRGHLFAACIHFLVGRFSSPRIRHCKETTFLTVRSRVVPYACAPVATGGSFLWVEMVLGLIQLSSFSRWMTALLLHNRTHGNTRARRCCRALSPD